MILKIIGSVIVILSCSFIGMVLSRDCVRRPAQLRELQGSLHMLENQICFLCNVIIDAFEKISRVGGTQTGIFFARTIEILKEEKTISATEAWERAISQCIGRTALNSEDREILLAFGKLLGKTDVEGQIRNIRHTLEQLKLQEEKAEENRKKNEGMYRSLGILGGLAVVTLLL
jgi:stage III sporulation protein AB